jgi:RNA polymerase primary sigma factor
MTNADTGFLKEVKELPLLTAAREKELGSTIQKFKQGSQKDSAIVELVEHNLRLAVKEAYKYARRSNVAVDELYNAGRAGLVRAAHDYNPIKYNTRFSTYATPWIRQGIREVIHGNSPVKIPLHIINGLYKKNRAVEENGKMTDAELRDELELTEAQLERINKAHISSVSLNMPVGRHANDHSSAGENSTLGDIMPDDNAEIPGNSELDDPRYDFLTDAMGELDEMSQDIVKAQILDADKTKLSDLGDRYGISGERVRQIKEKALKKLKKKIVCRMSVSGYTLPEDLVESLIEPPKKKRGRPRKKA